MKLEFLLPSRVVVRPLLIVPGSPSENGFIEPFNGKLRDGLLKETWTFVKEQKIWWMGPIILALLLVGVLVALTSTGAAPFIYTLF